MAMRNVLRHPTLDAAFKELVLTLPSETYIAEQLEVVDPQRIHAVREAMRAQLADALQADWEWAFETHKDNGAYRPDPVSSGRRALAGMALAYLCLAATRSGDVVWPGKTQQRFKDANNMTDRFNALQRWWAAAIPWPPKPWHVFMPSSRMRNWCWTNGLHAGRHLRPWRPGAAGRAPAHEPPGLPHQEPERARSLIFSYCSANPGAFHRQDAAGYVSGPSACWSSTPSTRRWPHAWPVPWTAGSAWPNPTAAPHAKRWCGYRAKPTSATMCVKSWTAH